MNDIDRPADAGAGQRIFGFAVLGIGRGHDAEDRRLADRDRHRAGLTARPPFAPDEIAVLAISMNTPQRRGIVHHDPVGAY